MPQFLSRLLAKIESQPRLIPILASVGFRGLPSPHILLNLYNAVLGRWARGPKLLAPHPLATAPLDQPDLGRIVLMPLEPLGGPGPVDGPSVSISCTNFSH